MGSVLDMLQFFLFSHAVVVHLVPHDIQASMSFFFKKEAHGEPVTILVF